MNNLLHIGKVYGTPLNRSMRVFTPTEVPQVFFNYRGEQLRCNFISHLVDAFERHKINFFVDKYEQRGTDLSDLFVRIEESRIALAVFSTRYAESSWCMDELVTMKELVDQGRLQVIPIFYNVKAHDVRDQEGEFGEHFWKLARNSSEDKTEEWKEALECISNKMGLSLKDYSSEAKFVKKIVKEVKRVIAAIEFEEEEKKHFEEKQESLRIIAISMYLCFSLIIKLICYIVILFLF